MEKIVIASLDLNTDELVKRASDTKKAIDSLRQANKDLAKAEGDNTQAIVRNEAEIKKLSAEYRRQQTAVTAMIGANSELVQSQEAINIATQREITSVNDARASNAELLRLRNELNVTTEEGQQALVALNGALNRNNEFIRQNASELEKQKINIGNYGNAFKESAQSINPLNGGLLGFAQRAQEAGGAGNLLKAGLGGMTGAMFQLIKASLAFIATPLGAALAVLAGGFLLIKNAMNRSEESGGKITKLFSTLGGVFNAVMKVLEPLGDFIINNLVKYFETLGKVASTVISGVSSALSFLGFEEASKAIDDFTESTEKSIKASRDLANAEKELEKAQRQARITQLQFQKDAEKLRQIRDDETKSTEERIKANEDLGKTLENQLNAELRIARLRLNVVNQQIEQQGKTKDLLDAQAEALTEIVDIEERITGQVSEQLVNRNALIKEANEKAIEQRNKYFENEIRRQNENIELYLAQQGLKAKSLEDEFLIAQELKVKRLKLLETEFKSGAISKTKYEAEKLNIANEFLLKQSELAVDIARREVEDKLAVLPSLIEGQKFISEEQLRLETERLNQVKKIEQDFAKKQRDELLITEEEYQNQLKTIQNNFQLQKDEAEKLRRETVEEQRKIDLENELILNEDEFERLRSKLETEKQIELDAAEKVGADLSLIEEKYARKSIEIENQVAEARRLAKLKELKDGLQLYAGLTDALQAFFGENKQIATASAIVNGGLAITEILAQKSELPAVATAIFKGLQIATAIGQTKSSIQQINSAKFADGTIQSIEGNSHARGGVPIYAGDKYIGEAEGNEGIGIFNKGAFNYINEVNARFRRGASDAGNYFENGAILSQGITLPNTGIDYNELARVVASAPAPIVRVDALNEAFEVNQNIVKVASF
jgi:hypothetical protein